MHHVRNFHQRFNKQAVVILLSLLYVIEKHIHSTKSLLFRAMVGMISELYNSHQFSICQNNDFLTAYRYTFYNAGLTIGTHRKILINNGEGGFYIIHFRQKKSFATM